MPTIRMIGERIARTCRLQTEPLAIYGSEEIPEGVASLPAIHRCIAAAMVKISTSRDLPAFYMGSEARAGCCPGGLAHTGYLSRPPSIRYFVSTGRPDIPDSPAEYLKASPDLVDRCFDAIGTITPPGKYLVIRTCASVPDSLPEVRAISCFGTAEQIRNISALVHFDRADPFLPVLVPWGPACATVVTYPAGMASHAPLGSAFMGPQDPTLNWALPEGMMAIGLPYRMALGIVEKMDRSFIVKRPSVAFPDHGDVDDREKCEGS